MKDKLSERYDLLVLQELHDMLVDIDKQAAANPRAVVLIRVKALQGQLMVANLLKEAARLEVRAASPAITPARDVRGAVLGDIAGPVGSMVGGVSDRPWEGREE